MSNNFMEALDVKMDDVEKPPLVPAGHYVMECHKQPIWIDRGKNNEWKLLQFPLKGIEATDDVDQEDLADFGGEGAIFLAKEFMFNMEETDKATIDNAKTWYYIKTFINDSLGIDTADMTQKEALDAAVGGQCIAEVTWAPNPKEPGDFYIRVGKTAAAD